MNIIVSGASGGIGYAVAQLLDQFGYRVLAIARREKELVALQKECKQLSCLAIDINDDGFKDALYNIICNWEGVDALINNAGGLINKPFMETNRMDFEEMMQSNLYTVVSLSQLVIPLMINAEHPHIVNISSMGGFHGSIKYPGLSAYSAAKAAINCLSECMAEELKESGIHVNALSLGAVQTEMLKKAFPDYAAPVSPTEMAKFIVDFTLNNGQYMNGKVLPVALGNP